MLKQPINVPTGKDRYRLIEDYSVEVTISHHLDPFYNERYKIIVPSGFENDGASIPKLFQWYFRKDGLIRGAAVCHDLVYRTAGIMPQDSLFQPCGQYGEHRFNVTCVDRKFADLMFRELLLRSGFSGFKATLAYLGVRIGGWYQWNKNRKK